MHKTTLLTGAMIVSALPCFAQTNHNCGFLFVPGTNIQAAVGATSRGPAAGRYCEIEARFDFDDYRAYGDPQITGGSNITGFSAIIQDQDGSTVENFNVHIYAQDPSNNDFPNYAAGSPPGAASLGSVIGLAGPNNAGGPVAFLYTVNFTTPILVPNDVGDVFWSAELPANPLWTADALSVQIILGVQPGPTFLVYDIPGASPISQSSYGLVHDVTNSTFPYGGRRQVFADLRTDVPSAVGTAVTNQTTLTISNTVPGVASFMSGLHPDAASPSANSGRADDIGLVVFPDNITPGSLVFELAAFGFQNPMLPLSAFLAGSRGMLCVPVTATPLGFQIEAGVRLDYNIAIPAGVRPSLGGGQFVFTAIALDPVSLTLSGLPCVRQAL